jgi:hypothetical protein
MPKLSTSIFLPLLPLLIAACSDGTRSIDKDSMLLKAFESPDTFFEAHKSTGVKVGTYAADGAGPILEFPKSSTVKVQASFDLSRPKGTFIFYLKPESGGYQNALFATGYLSGENEISGITQYFYIPDFGQLAGPARVFVYVPGQGAGETTLTVSSR